MTEKAKEFRDLFIVDGAIVVQTESAKQLAREQGNRFAACAKRGEYKNRGHMVKSCHEAAGKYARMIIETDEFQAGLKALK